MSRINTETTKSTNIHSFSTFRSAKLSVASDEMKTNVSPIKDYKNYGNCLTNCLCCRKSKY